MVPLKEAMEAGREIPEWITVDSSKCRADIVALPNRESVTHPIQEQLIVEFFSR